MNGTAGIEVTGLASSSGPLTKRISLAPDGRLISDGSACVMNRGIAQRVRLDGVAGFADLTGRLSSSEAIALGALRPDLPDKVEIMTARRLAEANGSAPPFAISRTASHIGYVPQVPALALLDFDTKGMPESESAPNEASASFASRAEAVSACIFCVIAARVPDALSSMSKTAPTSKLVINVWALRLLSPSVEVQPSLAPCLSPAVSRRILRAWLHSPSAGPCRFRPSHPSRPAHGQQRGPPVRGRALPPPGRQRSAAPGGLAPGCRGMGARD